MDDLISRQAAIDAVSRGCQEFRGIFAECEKNLNALPAVQTCDDAVSRQAAIDALMKRDKELRNINWYDKPFAEGECKGIDYALEIVNALPSVQPTQSNAYNALKTLDCIDRQAAMELVKDVCDAIMSGCESWYDPETEDEVYKDIREVDAILKCNKEVRIALRNMPSVQPQQIVRCKDCKHWRDSDGVYRRGTNAESKCPLNTQEVYAGTFYCGYAERRTDGCD